MNIARKAAVNFKLIPRPARRYVQRGLFPQFRFGSFCVA